ncbi:MAG: hypothetical protein B6U87_00630 [Candidatus Aenigmarchaeota archaeon ex4484_52]|nr:MAG: hypothetical protein B6U87_00630 [Candidatus Aenigmarchaeota archaeon ex4484_52]
MIKETIYIKIIICLLILSFGFILSKIGEKLIIFLWRKKYKISIEKVEIATIYVYVVNCIAIIIALSFLKINIEENLLIKIYEYLPFILSIVLIGILIIILIHLIFFFINKFLTTSGLIAFVKEYEKEQVLLNILIILKYTLYFIFSLIGLQALGVNIDSAVLFLKNIAYPFLILGLVFLFYGLKPFVENYFLGFFFKQEKLFTIGEQIKMPGQKQKITIESMKKIGVIASTKNHSNVFIPYKKLFEKQIFFKKITYDLDTLNKIKQHFIAQEPSYCGPASVSMILKIFGYDISQEKIGKLARTVVPPQKNLNDEKIGAGGTKPQDLIDVVEQLTKNKVKGVWININRITNLKLELKTWLNNKALIIVDYKKSFLFPEAKKAHYSVCFAVKGDELLILDPGVKKGGVYFADVRKIYLGMNTYSELLKEKRGYIVLAPKGTTAYKRIQEGLIFSDPNLYNDLSNSMANELDKLIKKASDIDFVLPKSIKKIIDEYKKKDKITHLWRPNNERI